MPQLMRAGGSFPAVAAFLVFAWVPLVKKEVGK
jgi:hypothetical protein